MITQTVTVTERNAQNIIIGRRGTYSTEEIVFELSSLISDFGDGSAVLMVKRPTDASAYPAVTVRDGDNLVWTISETDTSFKGHGECELFWYVENGLAKSIIWPLTILRDIGTTEEEPPDPYESWIDSLTALGAETLENAQAAEQSASDANGYKYEAYGYARGAAESQYYAEQARNQAQTAKQGAEAARNEAWEISSHYPTIIDGYWAVWHDGQYWKTSYKAEGVDGRGITNVTGVKSSTSGLVDTYTLTVTYTDGDTDTITFTVTNGRDGTDGVSPGVTIETITGGHRVTITDKDHPTGQSFDVMDGEVSQADLDAALDTKAPVIIDTASGAIASFSDGADNMPVKNLVCQINPVQSGTGDPSPTNIRPISGWTGLSLTRDGVNLFNKNSPDNVLNRYLRITDGGLNPSSSGYDTSGFISAKPNVSYVLNGVSTTGVLEFCFYDIGQTFISGISTSARTFTTPQNTAFIRFDYKHIDLDTVQLELGTTASAYQPYQGETIPVSWQTEAGTVYGGYINPITGVLTVDRAIFSPVINVVTVQANASQAITRRPDNVPVAYSQSDIGTEAIYGVSSTPNHFYSNGQYFVLFGDKTLDTVDKWNAHIAENNYQICYKLATPITVQLDPVTVSTLLGENNIWHDANGDVSVDYCADTKLYLEKLTQPTEDDMIANANIAANKFFMIGNTLYFSTAAIAQGATIVPGNNCNKVSLADALNTLNA